MFCFLFKKKNPFWGLEGSGSGSLILVPVLYLLYFQREIFQNQVPRDLLAQLPAFPLQLLGHLDAPHHPLLHVILFLDEYFPGQGTCELSRQQEKEKRQSQSVGIGG